MPIAICKCRKDTSATRFQDLEHGIGRRVVNPINKSTSNKIVQRYRCTACGSDVDKSTLIKSNSRE